MWLEIFLIGCVVNAEVLANDNADPGLCGDSKIHVKCTIPVARELLSNNPSHIARQSVFEFLTKTLTQSQSPPIDEIINEGLVPYLVQGLYSNDINIQFKAACALTNLVAGTTDQTQKVVKYGVTQAFIKMAYITTNESLAEQSIWGLANIIGDGAELRDEAITHGFFDLFSHYISKLETLELSFVQNLAWACRKLCRHEPPLGVEEITIIFSTIKTLIKQEDECVRINACWALAHLDYSNDKISELVLKADILPSVFTLLKSNITSLMKPALRFFGNFAIGNNDVTQSIIDMGVINDEIPMALKSSDSKILIDACWIIAIVLAGNGKHVQAVIDSGVISRVIELLRHENIKVQSEAAWAISNLCCSGTKEQIYHLAEIGILDYIVPVLNNHDDDFNLNLLSIIGNVFNAVRVLHPKINKQYKNHFEEIGGINFVRSLEYDDNPQIIQFSSGILYTWRFEMLKEITNSLELSFPKLKDGASKKFLNSIL